MCGSWDAAACPGVLVPSQGLGVAALATFLFPKKADFRTSLLQTVFSALPPASTGDRKNLLPHCPGFLALIFPGNTHLDGFQGANSSQNPSASFPGKAAFPATPTVLI